MVVFICILGGIGTAGVPAGSIPVIAMILGLVGVSARRHRHHPRRRPRARHVPHDGERHRRSRRRGRRRPRRTEVGSRNLPSRRGRPPGGPWRAERAQATKRIGGRAARGPRGLTPSRTNRGLFGQSMSQGNGVDARIVVDQRAFLDAVGRLNRDVKAPASQSRMMTPSTGLTGVQRLARGQITWMLWRDGRQEVVHDRSGARRGAVRLRAWR